MADRYVHLGVVWWGGGQVIVLPKVMDSLFI